MIGEIIGWLIVGLIIGALARLLMPGRDPMGCLMTALLGIAGSVIGGFIGRLIGWGARPGAGYFTPTKAGFFRSSARCCCCGFIAPRDAPEFLNARP